MAEREVPVGAQKEILNALRGATTHGPATSETLVQLSRVAENKAKKPETAKKTKK